MDSKVTSILSYFFGWIGWLVAFLAGDREDPVAKVHLNNTLLLNIAISAFGLLSGVVSVLFVIPILGTILAILYLLLFAVYALSMAVFWIIGLIGAFTGEPTALPLIGRIRLLR